MIYFITDDNTSVKIGYTDVSHDIEMRMGSLQCGNPRELVLLGTLANGGRAVERYLHKFYADIRIRGEWFELTDDLREFIEECNADKTLEVVLPEKPKGPGRGPSHRVKRWNNAIPASLWVE